MLSYPGLSFLFERKENPDLELKADAFVSALSHVAGRRLVGQLQPVQLILLALLLFQQNLDLDLHHWNLNASEPTQRPSSLALLFGRELFDKLRVKWNLSTASPNRWTNREGQSMY